MSSGNLKLKTGETLDHETESTVTLDVTADDGDNTITQEFTLTVVDVNESPTNLTIGSLTVDEETDGAVVGSLTVTDPDDSNESFGQHTFSVDDNRFEVSSGNLKLKTGETLDHETESTVTLDVTADDGDNTITQEFTLTVVDVNESPTNLTIGSLTVDEETDGAVVGSLTVTDPGRFQRVVWPTYLLSVDDAPVRSVLGRRLASSRLARHSITRPSPRSR